MASNVSRELLFFRSHNRPMRILLLVNLLYAMALPIIELFVGAYIMRNSKDISLVVIFQLAVYTGIPFTFMLNGFLLNHFPISRLYAFGMLLSGVSMSVMMNIDVLNTSGIFLTGLIMGLSYGFFWANRDFLALNTTKDSTRNYYFGIETFFYTVAAIIIPLCAGLFIKATVSNGWFGRQVNVAYYVLTAYVFILTISASRVAQKGDFKNPLKGTFFYWKFDILWKRMLQLASLKGIAQGYIVTAPVMLIMKMVGDEGSLGAIQSMSALLSAVMLYFIGRLAKPEHRLLIFTAGLVLFFIGACANAVLYSSSGVIFFAMCLVFARPLLDMGYYPLQLRVIDVVSKKENRNQFSYIFNHEWGLYFGRLIGCGLFIALANRVSEEVALRYALLVIAAVQMLSILMARNITKRLKVDDGKAISRQLSADN